MSFALLPQQLTYYLLENFLTDKEWCAIASICKRFHSLLDQDTFWKSLCSRQFGSEVSSKNEIFKQKIKHLTFILERKRES